MTKLVGGRQDGLEYDGHEGWEYDPNATKVTYPGPHWTDEVYYRVTAPDGTVYYQHDDESGQEFTP